MNKPSRFIFLLLLLAALSCKKEELPGSGGNVGTPTFVLNNSVDGSAMDLAAGMEDYYMFTEFNEDADTILTFVGTLKKENCAQDCGSQLRVEIRDYQKTPDRSDFRLNQALRCGTYKYRDLTSPFVPGSPNGFEQNNLYQVNLYADTDIEGPIQYTWTYRDHFTSGMAKNMPDPVINVLLKPFGSNLDDVFGLEVEDEEGNKCYREHSKIIGRDYELCYADFTAKRLSNGNVKLEAQVEGGLDPFGFEWSTGETTQSIEVPAEDNTYELSILSGTDRCSNLIRKTIKMSGNDVKTVTCSFNWDDDNNSWNKYRLLSGGKFQFSTVILVYTDEDGTVYRSDLNAQSDNSSFEVLGVEPFNLNENGEKTVKLDIRYTADVFDIDGNRKTISGDGTIAVAYP
ncbi:MAG: hypothetical protein AAFO94_15820 [Bacteroidota bacterium]